MDFRENDSVEQISCGHETGYHPSHNLPNPASKAS